MRADRLIRLLMLLQRHRRAKASWLAERLEVSERTVLRDMQALSASGVPVFTEQGRGGGCVLVEGYTTQASGLTTGEAQALFAWTTRETATDLGLGADLAGALAKIAATAPSDAVAGAEAMADVVAADRRSWYGAKETLTALPTLRQALATHRRLRIRYTSAESAAPRARTLDPIGLVDNAGRWYLVAEHRGRVRTYRVSRVAEVEVLRQRAEPHERRPVLEVWRELRSALESQTGSTGIEVLVDADEAPRLRRLLSMQLVAGGVIVETPEGEGRLRWRLPVRQTDVIAAMAVLAAPSLTLVEPAWLRGDVVAAAERATRHYS